MSDAAEVNEVWTAGGPVWVNLVNTIALAGKGMTDIVGAPRSLHWWFETMGLGAPSTLGPQDVVFAAELRECLSRVIQSVEQGAPIGTNELDSFNSVLSKQHEWTRLDQLDNGTFVRKEIRSTDTIEQAFGPVVESLCETLVHGDLSRLRCCAHQDCALRFYDDSKNAARRWCTMSGCGNRAKAAAYLQRKKGGGSTMA